MRRMVFVCEKWTEETSRKNIHMVMGELTGLMPSISTVRNLHLDFFGEK